MLSDQLFTEVTSEESATVSGGLNFDWNTFIFAIGASTLPNTPGGGGGSVITQDERLLALQLALEV